LACHLVCPGISKAAHTVKCAQAEVCFMRAFDLTQFELDFVSVTKSYGKLPASAGASV
jgi:hypothetical protein